MINSIITDSINESINFESEYSHYLGLQNNTIISIIDLKREKKVRFLIRNSVGKFCWDLKQFHHSVNEIKEKHTCIHHIPKSINLDLITSDDLAPPKPQSKLVDILEHSLLKMQKQYPEVYNQHEIQDTDLKTIIATQSAYESESNSDFDKNVLKTYEMAQPSYPVIQDSQYKLPRTLLSHLGKFSFDCLKDGETVYLQKSPTLLRDLKGLDKKPSRENYKFALIYVKNGQEDEHSIFKNTQGSQLYLDFIETLGWWVDLSTHTGYSGGLDFALVKSGKALYFCSSRLEIIYHDTTAIQTDLNDPIQVKKKRHIGNDYVHIVWNEHDRDYKPHTIGGDFGNVQICITPLTNGLYSVNVYQDENVDVFGPLFSNTVVSKENLGNLVRCTAINAYRACVLMNSGEQSLSTHHPYTSREENISVIINRHKTKQHTFAKYLTLMMTSFGKLEG